MKKRKIYLHIGTHKTGSTSLQNFLFENSEKLKKYDFDYISDECIWQAHHPIGWLLQGNSQALKEHYPKANIGVINAIEESIRYSTSSNILLSSENLFLLKNLEAAEAFFNRFSDFDFEVVAYLRPQYDFIESWYAELVRADYYKLNENFGTFINNPRYPVDYLSQLKRWENFVSRKNIKLKNFDIEKKDGKLIKNFLLYLNIAESEIHNFKFKKNKNESLIGLQVDLARVLNNFQLENKTRHDILINIEKFSTIKLPRINQKSRKNIFKKYFLVNQEIESNYGIDLGLTNFITSENDYVLPQLSLNEFNKFIEIIGKNL